MANNERTSHRVASIAARGFDDPASLTLAEIRTVCASALTQAPDHTASPPGAHAIYNAMLPPPPRSLGLLPPAPLGAANALWSDPLPPTPIVSRNALAGPLDDLKRALWPEFLHAPRTTLPSVGST